MGAYGRERQMEREEGAQARDPAEELIAAVLRKLEAHREQLGSPYGRLTWRRREGKVDLQLEVRL
jgi:hypothetical protein